MKRKIMMGLVALATLWGGKELLDKSARAAQESYIVIGTGGITGVYYPVGVALCRLINDETARHGIHCSVESTAGSVANLQGLRSGTLQFGISQSDTQYAAYRGQGAFRGDGANKDLRAVFSLHSEPMTLVARSDSGIQSFADLEGKRVNIGPSGSGARATVDAMLSVLGWDKSKNFRAATELSTSEQSSALCDGKVDAIFFSVGHPSSTIREAMNACDAQLVPITGPGVDKLVSGNSYYSYASIPAATYSTQMSEVKTFGVRAVLLASANTPDAQVYELVKTIFTHMDAFRRMHPALGTVQPEEMVKESMSVPLHPAAARYYREAGFMK